MDLSRIQGKLSQFLINITRLYGKALLNLFSKTIATSDESQPVRAQFITFLYIGALFVLLCFAIDVAETRNPGGVTMKKPDGAETVITPSSLTGTPEEHTHIRLADTKFGRQMRLAGPSAVTIYQMRCTPEQFKTYYKEMIEPWLKQQAQQSHQEYVPAIYALGNCLLVVSPSPDLVPWEGIAGLGEHVTRVDVERL